MYKKLLVILLSTTLILFVTSCSKDKNSNIKDPVKTIKENIEKTSLLSMIPKNSFGYAVFNLSSSGYEKYLNSPVTNLQDIVNKQISSMSKNPQVTMQIEKQERLMQALDSVFPMLPKSNSKSDVLVAYVAGESKDAFNFGVYGYSKEKNYYEKSLPKILNAFKEQEGLVVTPQGENKAKISEENLPFELSVKAEGNYFALTTLDQTTERLFSKLEKEDFFNMESQHYKKVSSYIKSTTKHPILLGHFDLTRIFVIFPELNAIPAQFKPLLNLIPTHLGVAASFDQSLDSVTAFHIAEEKLPNDFKGAFEVRKSGNFFSTLTDDTILATSFNPNFIVSILKYLLKTDLQNQDISKLLNEVIADEGEIGLALGQFNQFGMPDLQLSLPVRNAVEAIGKVKERIQGKARGSGVAGQWNQSEIEGAPVEYMLTPFGIGIYITGKEDKLIIASSEQAVRASLKGEGELGKSLAKNLLPELAQATALSNLYIDYVKGYNLILSLKNMFSMFTGGQNQIFDELAKIKEMGQQAITSTYEDDLLIVKSTQKFNTAS